MFFLRIALKPLIIAFLLVFRLASFGHRYQPYSEIPLFSVAPLVSPSEKEDSAVVLC